MKRFFVKGLFAILPIVLTAAVLYLVVGFLYNNVGVPIGEALKWGVARFGGEDPKAPSPHWAWLYQGGAPVVGFCVAILLTLSAGFFLATFFGKKLYRWYESVVKRVPLIGSIYPYARQFTDFFFGDENKQDFKTAVALPFPARGTYSIGFVTAQGMKALNQATGKEMICVFVPASPTPVSGFLVYVPREDLIPLPISVDEAMRIIISAGVIHPDHQAIGGGERRETTIRRPQAPKA